MRNLKDDFPTLSRKVGEKPLIYLDSAASSLMPRSVIEKTVSYYEKNGANIHRGKHFLSEEASDIYESSRNTISEFLGCTANEVVFVRNTTEGLNMVAEGLNLKADDIVLSTLDSHHSNLLPWRRRTNTKVVRINSTGTLDQKHFQSLLDCKPKLVALTHCSNVTGIYVDVENFFRLAKDAGAITVLDCAQSIPHRRIDVKKLNVDFLSFSAHKMLGPTGIGVLYGKAEHLERLEPNLIGGGTVDWVDQNGHNLRKVPHKFEAGTPHIAGAYGFGGAIEYLRRAGFANLMEHDRELSRCLYNEAKRRDYLSFVGTDAELDRCALISMRIRGCNNLGDIATALSNSYGIMCRSGHLCAQPLVDDFSEGEVLRASAYLYNSTDEIVSLFRALDELYDLLV